MRYVSCRFAKATLRAYILVILQAMPSKNTNRTGALNLAQLLVMGVGGLVLVGVPSLWAWSAISNTEGAQKGFVYSKMVDEVVTTDSLKNKEVRMEGELTPGSILFRQDPCEWRFKLNKNNKEIDVRYPECIVPDTFKDGMGISVVVQGALGNDGLFMATDVIPRCPSKYEMNEKQKNGEVAPHSMPTLP